MRRKQADRREPCGPQRHGIDPVRCASAGVKPRAVRRVPRKGRLLGALHSPIAWWMIGAGWLGTASCAAWVGFPTVLVCGGVVSGAIVILLSTVLGVVCWLVSALIMICGSSCRKERSGLARVVAVLSKVALIAVSTGWAGACAVMAFIGGLAMAITDWHVLEPKSADGCQIIVLVDWGISDWCSAEFYAVSTTSPVLVPVGGFWEHMAVDPFVTGDWSLTWNGSSGVLSVFGQDTTISCSVR